MVLINIDFTQTNDKLKEYGLKPFVFDSITFEAYSQEDVDAKCEFYKNQIYEWALKQALKKGE